MPHEDDKNPWNEYRRLVMDSLERIDKRLDGIDKRLGAIETQLTIQKVKMGLISALAGLVGGAMAAGTVRWFVG